MTMTTCWLVGMLLAAGGVGEEGALEEMDALPPQAAIITETGRRREAIRMERGEREGS